MGPASKTPSSLDYDGHLYELALRGFRRAVVAGDARRARAKAEALVDSPVRLWRFLGLVHLSTAHVLAGSVSAALDGLAAAERLLHRDPPLAWLASEHAARLFLARGEPARALARLEVAATASPASRYALGMASAAAGQPRRARALAATLPAGLRREHLGATLAGDLRRLEALSASVGDDELASDAPAAPIRFELGEKLASAGRAEAAREAYDSLADRPEVRPFWPIVQIRSLERAGSLAAAAGDAKRARELLGTFVSLWGDGELDRDAVRRARQSSIA